MANPRTDLAGNESLPRTITHFGDGSAALTNRDVSSDLANLDLALTALRDAIAGAGAGTKTLANVVTAVENLDLEVSDVASETTLALIKAKTDNLDLALSALRDVVRGAVVGATSSPAVAAGATVDVTYTPTAGKTARITAAWMWETTDNASSWTRIFLKPGGSEQSVNLSGFITNGSGAGNGCKTYPNGGLYADASNPLVLRFYNAGSGAATNVFAEYIACEH